LEPTTQPYFQSHYMPNTPAQRHSMLNSIGIKSIEELFNDIPEAHRNPTLKIPPPMPELDLRNELMSMSSNNHNVIDNACFLGAGVYNHFIPSIVIPLITRGEFLTSYTPYQAEASQGTLQVAYEFQTMVCNLMGMDVANDGMYEGATSVAEAALMACRITGRDGIAIINTMSPTYREVVETYTKPQGLKIHLVDPTNLVIPKETACVLAQYPNFFGYIEDLSVYKKACDESGSLLIVSTDPVAMGMFRPPGDLGADIVTGEGQGLGIPMSFGGPHIGLFATKDKYVRQMPGRIVGKTVDSNNNPGYVLTLQPREQHIRREKATSNICTSQALLALASTITIAALGKHGLRQMAELCYHKAHYAASLIQKLDGYSLPIDGTFFKEMVVKCPVSPSIINERLLKDRIIGGLDISHIMADCMLLCITEMNSKTEIESLAKILSEFK
jgi:glycine dehydrogenase subunit 1